MSLLFFDISQFYNKNASKATVGWVCWQ